MRGLRLCLLATLLLTTFAGCGGCGRRADATGRDATTDGSVEEGRSSWRARVAARILGSQATIARLEDGALAMSAGHFVYRIGKDGDIERLGSPRDYLPFVPEDEDSVRVFPSRTITGRYDRVFVTLRTTPPTSFVWDRKTWAKATENVPPEPPKLFDLEARYDSDDGDPDRALLPKGSTWVFRIRLPDGRRGWRSAEDEFFLVDAKGTGGAPAPMPVRTTDGGSCRFLESADDHLYASCQSLKSGTFVDVLLRLEGTTWVEIRLPKIADTSFHVAAVDSEGGVWLIVQALHDSLMRVARDGKTETIPLPDAPEGLSRAYYHTNDFVFADDDVFMAQTTIVAGRTSDTKRVVETIPRKSGDVWVAVRGQTVVLYRVARDGAAHAPVLMSALPDERVAIDNERPARDWVGHCRGIFVTLASAAPGQKLASIADRLADIREALGPATAASVVTGRLSGQGVAGVVLLQSFTTADGEEKLESAAARLIERFTTNPASPPRATCTLPILDEVVFTYP